MIKVSRLAIVAAIMASIATPALAQYRYTHRRPYNYYPAPGVAAPYSNYPAATAWDNYRIILAQAVHHCEIIEASLSPSQ